MKRSSGRRHRPEEVVAKLKQARSARPAIMLNPTHHPRLAHPAAFAASGTRPKRLGYL